MSGPTPVTSVPNRELPVDVEELCIALASEGSDLRWFLDTQTGDVVLVSHEYDPADNAGLTAEEIEGDALRFVPVPVGDPGQVVEDMAAFTGQLGDGQLKESLELALSAPRPEKRFKTTLSWLPETQQRWRSFRLGRCRDRAVAWLADLGIVAIARAV